MSLYSLSWIFLILTDETEFTINAHIKARLTRVLHSRMFNHRAFWRKYMNKSELVEAVAQNVELTKSNIEDVLNATLDLIKKNVKKGDDVTLVGFGTFTKSKRKARMGRNPQTGKEIKIPAMTVPRFRAGKEFKETVR
jgi:DNA-binding protein HU-beta